MKIVYIIILILVLIGALNLGSIGFFDFDALMWLINTAHPAVVDPETTELIANPWVAKCTTIWYDVIGVSGILLLAMNIFKCKKSCKK